MHMKDKPMLPILSRVLTRLFKLPPAETYNVVVDRNLRVPMQDGTVLLADHYYTPNRRTAPTILVRSPYGRAGVFALVFARPFAERGFQVLIQSCRGTFGSGGAFNAFRNEQRDGLDSAPINLVGGWYDIFLPQILADYAGLRQADKRPYLTIGPWAHSSFAAFPYMIRESLAWFQTYLLGEPGRLRKAPVRVFVMGRNRWKGLPDWPPPGYQAQRWFLQTGHALAPQPPDAAPPDRYRYDPAHPTPAVGGSSLSANSGPRDNRAVEARQDVLVYTSAELDQDIEVIGPVRAELFVQSSLEHTDFFVRLCDVDSKGKSINISDGLVRLCPGEPTEGDDGVRQVSVELWATAHCFQQGHRVRVQVAGGSHPRYARNPGSGEPLATATTLHAADHTVYHDAGHPSAIMLPVKNR
jgi:putative CocE/NonD family hydrolase